MNVGHGISAIRREQRCVTVVWFAMLLAAPLTAQTPRALEVNDLFAMKRVGDPQISPEGEWVAYTVTETNLEEEKSETRIWMVPTAGGEAIPMTREGTSASRPRWSPDGRYLSFMSARDGGKTQVWSLNRLGGEAQQLTDVKQGVSDYVWSPDGTRLLLSIRDPEEEKPGEGGEGCEAESETRPPWVIDRLQFKRDGTGYLTGNRHSHLYVFDVATGELTQITTGNYDESQPVWSPDGRRVAFVSNRTEEPDANSNSDIWIVGEDAGSGDHQPRSRSIPCMEPRRRMDRLHHRYRAGDHLVCDGTPGRRLGQGRRAPRAHYDDRPELQ
ncbi:MAG: TolB family protein [Gemmatimonadales bacterium]